MSITVQLLLLWGKKDANDRTLKQQLIFICTYFKFESQHKQQQVEHTQTDDKLDHTQGIDPRQEMVVLKQGKHMRSSLVSFDWHFHMKKVGKECILPSSSIQDYTLDIEHPHFVGINRMQEWAETMLLILEHSNKIDIWQNFNNDRFSGIPWTGKFAINFWSTQSYKFIRNTILPTEEIYE